MKRVFRWLFCLVAATCGLATLAIAVLWVRSYGRHGDGLRVNDGVAYSSDGELCFEYEHWSPDFEPPCSGYKLFRDHPQWECRISRDPVGQFAFIRCPHWAVLLPLLLVDAALVRRGVIRWRRRRRAGCCEQCGYNLTGNVSGVCPECGTPTRAAGPRPPAPAEPRP